MPFPFHIVDLTHDLSPDVPSWNGSCGFHHEIKLDYQDCRSEVKFRVQQLKMHAGIGTHIDAPRHCFKEGRDVASLSLQNLITSSIVIDISSKAHSVYDVSAEDVLHFENNYGKIPPSSFVIIRTGWDQYWQEPAKYRNNFAFPALSKEATLLLLERNIAGLGIDTLSPDRPENGYFTHESLLGANKYIVENIANSKLLPPIGSYSLALPIKTVEGAEAPIRLIGLIP